MKPLAITLGDPAGIGGEVVIAALQQMASRPPVWLFGEWDYVAALPNSRTTLQTFRRVTQFLDGGENGDLFFDVALGGSRPLQYGVVEPLYGAIALASIEAAHEAIDRGLCSGMVTAPLNKQAINAAGSKFPGHTELLAARSGLHHYAFDYAMYFDSPNLRVALLSVHLPLRRALDQISAGTIAALARLVSREYARLYGSLPRMAAAGVNPHAGEGGLFGAEDELVAAGVRQATEEGLLITGPHAADTVFHSAVKGRHDVVLAMYHDQGLIAIKTLAFASSVNVTIGLPYLRCSVDHGTAFDIAGKGLADATPMRQAIEWGLRHASRFVP